MTLSFEQASLTYGAGPAACRAVQSVTFELAAGELAALMGASGSGKTSLLNMAAGLDRPTEGVVRVLGQDVGQAGEAALCRLRRSGLGFVFQSLNLLGAMTAADNIELPLVLNGWKCPDRRRRVDELLGLAGLSDKALSFPGELSGGQQQRLAVLRAIAHRPALVLMDEPTSCLDTATASQLMDLVLQLNQREGTTVLMATHDPAVAQLAKRTIHLQDGRIVGDS